MLLADGSLALTGACFTVNVYRASSQTGASSNVRQPGGVSTGPGGGRCGHLHHHLSVEELRLIQVKNALSIVNVVKQY